VETAGTARAQEIRDFWFGSGAIYGTSRKQWFQKDPAFDDEVRARFIDVYERAAEGHLEDWHGHAHDCLALIIVLDQFPRNMFRGSGRAFAADHLARRATEHALALGFDRLLRPVERMFIYLPLEHSELLADQERCVALMQTLAPFAETRELHVWAEKHRRIIERFGRFPHRNAALGRASTADEIAFLQQPGSGF
jgi:uncharacterized protein (DUF924 family)